MQALDSSADPFFTRNTYNRADFFSDDLTTQTLGQEVQDSQQSSPTEAEPLEQPVSVQQSNEEETVLKSSVQADLNQEVH